MTLKTLILPIKGCYYYSADLADSLQLLEANTRLMLVAEPENPVDTNAVQVWLDSVPHLLLGYIPRKKARFFQFLLTKNHPIQVSIKSLSYPKQQLHLTCQIDYHHCIILSLHYWLSILKRLNIQAKHTQTERSS